MSNQNRSAAAELIRLIWKMFVVATLLIVFIILLPIIIGVKIYEKRKENN